MAQMYYKCAIERCFLSEKNVMIYLVLYNIFLHVSLFVIFKVISAIYKGLITLQIWS